MVMNSQIKDETLKALVSQLEVKKSRKQCSNEIRGCEKWDFSPNL